MQSVQLPNVGILLSKKGRDSEWCGSSSKVFCEVPIHRKWHQMIKWNSDKADSVHDFELGMQCSFPEHREGLTEWKGEIVDGVQDFLGKFFARNEAFREMEGE